MLLRNLTFRQKIAVFLAVVFVFISAGLYAVYKASLRSLLSEQSENLERISRLTSDRLHRKEEEMTRLVNLFQSDRPLIEYLYIYSVLAGDKEPLINMLRPMYLSLNVDSLTLYDRQGRGILEMDTRAGEKLKEAGSRTIEGTLPDEIVHGFTEAYGTVIITGAGPLKYMGRTLGYISVGKYLDSEYLEELKDISGNEFLFVKEGKITVSTLSGAVLSYSPSKGKLRVDKNTYSVHEEEIRGMSGIALGKVVTAISDERLRASLGTLRLYIFGMLGAAIFISGVLSMLFIKGLVNPLRAMVYLIGKVSRGEFDRELRAEGRDETAVLSRHFNDMQRQLKAQREALERYTDDLERAVEERTKELEKVQRQLLQSQKMESLGTLASGIAHDFNNLLSAILGYASFVKDAIEPSHPHYKYWDIIEQAALRGTELTTNLLTFSGGRAVEGKKKLIDINQLIAELVRLLGRTLSKSIAIETKLKEGKHYVLGSGNAIFQALMNICLNARDAMPSGGRLILETSALRVDEAIGHPAGNYIRTSITDTGVGMKKEVVDRIFEPFFTTKEAGRGTGLGLSIVYGVVQEHGGFVNVYSEPGKGSSFSIYLPLAEEGEITEKEEPLLFKEPARGQTILVVDDEEPMRRLCAEILEASGYKVLQAAGGREALEIFEKHRGSVSAVILDMVMPEMSGHDTLRKLRETEPGLKVITTSGFSPEMAVHWVKESGAKGFIQKPFRAHDILSKVRDALR